jgi:RNA polymerase sigma-70 factor (ECF subfamily)
MREGTLADQIVTWEKPLRAYARRLTRRNPDLVDDLVQETIVRALLHSNQFETGTNLGAWLHTILRNTFFTEVRLARRYAAEGCAPEREASSAAQTWAVELGELSSHYTDLPDSQREAISFVAVNGDSYETAALKAGCAVGTMKSRVSRARAALSIAAENHLDHAA